MKPDLAIKKTVFYPNFSVIWHISVISDPSGTISA